LARCKTNKTTQLVPTRKSQNQAKTHKFFQNFPQFFKELVSSRVLVFKTKTQNQNQNPNPKPKRVLVLRQHYKKHINLEFFTLKIKLIL
jgi:hypothetical protein